MKLIPPFGRRGVLAVCILLSACAATGVGAPAPNPAYGSFLAARYADGIDDAAAASVFYSKALQAEPDNQTLAGDGFMAAVLAGNASALDLAPTLKANPLAAMALGNQAALAGHFDQANQFYQSLPQDDLTGLIKPMLLAWSVFGQGNEQAALNLLGPLFNNPGFGPVYLLNAALIADAAGDRADAAQLYAAVNDPAPNLREAQILASWAARQGQTGAAEAELDAMAANYPDLAIALPGLRLQLSQPVVGTPAYGLAEAYLTLAGALTQPPARFLRIAFLRFALSLRPDLVPARLLLAQTQIATPSATAQPTDVQVQNALASLAPVSKTAALYAPVAVMQANLLASVNRFEDAAGILRGLLVTIPDDPGLLGNLADILREGNDCPAAISYYTQAIAAIGQHPGPDIWSLYFDRGICADQDGRWDEAEPDMLSALRLSPDQPYVLNYLAYSWALHGQKLAQAKAMLTRAVGLDPDDGAVIDSLAFVDLKLGETATALALEIKAVELNADDAEENAHLGDAFWQAGRPLQADYQWQRALALHPDAAMAAQLRAKIAQHFGAVR